MLRSCIALLVLLSGAIAALADDASDCIQDRDLDRSIKGCTAIIGQEPSAAWALDSRGYAYGMKGEYDRAIRDYTNAIQLDPRYARAYSNRAIAYRAMGANDLATADMQTALSIDPSLQAGAGSALRFVCITKRSETSLWLNQMSRSQWDWPQAKLKDQCEAASMTGDIKKGDAAKFAEFLHANPLTRTLVLFSNGGSVAESIEIGRMVRSRFMTTAVGQNCPAGSCCMSACVLIAFAGVENLLSNIGVHRPGIEEMGGRDLSMAQATYKEGEKRIRAYLSDMEAPAGLADLMMGTDSDNIRIIKGRDLQGVITEELFSRFIFDRYRPPSIHEWTLAKCKSRRPAISGSPGDVLHQGRTEDCLAEEEEREFLRRHLR